MLNESKFFGPTFSRNLTERGEKWVLWMEFTWVYYSLMKILKFMT